jgi:hypothetical protein
MLTPGSVEPYELDLWWHLHTVLRQSSAARRSVVERVSPSSIAISTQGDRWARSRLAPSPVRTIYHDRAHPISHRHPASSDSQVTRMRICLVVLLALGQLAGAQAPQAKISSGRLHATLYLPDAQSGYYRGTRFDWSGVIAALEWNGHTTSVSGSSATIRRFTTRLPVRSRSS